jgi:AraC-like DNA-binding protein
LQQLYCNQLFAGTDGEQGRKTEFEPQPPQINPRDDSFMRIVIQTIEANMDNSEFAVEELAIATHISRTVFFKKIKSLTGLAPVEFIRDMKIKRAAQLLVTGQFSVKETACMVGITDSKYFNKCFKSKYGVTPSGYKREKTQGVIAVNKK